MAHAPVPCPFVYADGRHCEGHVVRVEVYKADDAWAFDESKGWSFEFFPRSHFHVFCSEKGNHSGNRRRDDARLKFYFDDLPEPLQHLILGTAPQQQSSHSQSRLLSTKWHHYCRNDIGPAPRRT